MSRWLIEVNVDDEVVKSYAEEGGYESPTVKQAIESELGWSLQSGIRVASIKEKEHQHEILP